MSRSIFNLRLRKASLSGGVTGTPKTGPGTLLRGWLRQQPPPQQRGSTFRVPPVPTFSKTLLISSEFWEMRTVEARRRRPFADLVGDSEWESAGVSGVDGDSESVNSFSCCEESEDPLKLMSVTDNDRTPRGSSGIGLFGCDVSDRGICRRSPL